MTGLDAIFVMAMITAFLSGMAFTLIGLLFISRNLDPSTPGDAISKRGDGQ